MLEVTEQLGIQSREMLSYENETLIIGYLNINSLSNKILNKSNKIKFMIINQQFVPLRSDQVT